MHDDEISVRLHRVMQRMSADGQADRLFDAEFPTDEKLWVEAHNLDPELFTASIDEARRDAENLDHPGYVDDWVQQLRDHYDRGRRPQHVDMMLLSRALRAAGVAADLVHHSGNTFVLKVGPVVDDIDDLEQAVVVCGPVKTIDGRAVGSIGTFMVGPADPPTSSHGPRDAARLLDPGRPWRVCEVVPVVLTCLDAQLARPGYDGPARRAHTVRVRRRVDAAVQQAMEAFWTAVSRAFPEVTTGDMDPLETLRLQRALTAAVGSWLAGNQPPGFWSSPHQSSPATDPSSTGTPHTDQESELNTQ